MWRCALAIPSRKRWSGGGWGGWLDAGWGGGRYQRELVPAERRGFYGCWLVFDRNRTSWGKRGWDTDYPLAVRNFMTRLTEFTTTPVNSYSDGAMADGVVRATDDGLFQCPFLFTSDVGTAVFSTAEADRLREYLLKENKISYVEKKEEEAAEAAAEGDEAKKPAKKAKAEAEAAPEGEAAPKKATRKKKEESAEAAE